MGDQRNAEAQIEGLFGVMSGLKDGSVSPSSEKAVNSGIYGIARSPPSPTSDPRMMEQGLFAYSCKSAATIETGQAKFADRQVAMLNAYHCASELFESA